VEEVIGGLIFCLLLVETNICGGGWCGADGGGRGVCEFSYQFSRMVMWDLKASCLFGIEIGTYVPMVGT
jgi:hypothetical protein